MEMKIMPADRLRRIHVVPYTHTDFAWTNTRQWHIWRYLQCFCDLLDLMREDEEITWCIDNVTHSWLPFQRFCPERVEEFRQRVREGRIQIANGGYSLARPNYVGEETWVRNLVAGKRYFAQTFGLPEAGIDFFFNADTAIGHSQLPQLLSQSGHKYYRSMRPEATLNFKGIPRHFLWRGLDGSEVAVARGEYGAFLYADYMDLQKPWAEIKAGFLKEEMEKHLVNADNPVALIFDGCDDVQPLCNLLDRPIPIREFFAQWNQREDSSIFFSTPDRFFADLLEQGVPTVEGPLEQGELSYNVPFKGEHSFWRLRKLLDRALLTLEAVSLLRERIDPSQPYPEAEIADLWTRLFEITGHAIEFIMRQDNEDLWQVGSEALLEAQTRIQDTVQDLAQLVKAEQGLAYAAVNPLAWDRPAAPVRLHVTSSSGIRGFKLEDGAGRPVPYQVVDVYTGDKNYINCTHNGVDVIAYPDLPALGVQVLRVREDGSDIQSHYRLEEMESVLRPLGQEMEPVAVDNGAIAVVFRGGAVERVAGLEGAIAPLRYTRTKPSLDWLPSWEAEEAYDFCPEAWGLLKGGPLRWVYRAEGRLGPHRARVDYILDAGQPEVRVETELECVAEEGYLTAPFRCDPATPVLVDIPFGAEARNLAGEPSRAFVPDGSAVSDYYAANFQFEQAWKGQYYGRNWTAFKAGQRDAAILATDCSIYYAHDDDQNRIYLMLNRGMDLSQKSDKRELRWVKQADPSVNGAGKHHYRYAYRLPQEGDIAPALARRVRELQQPALAAPRYGFAGGKLAQACSCLGVAPASVIATASYREENRTLLRVYESAGQATEACVAAPGYAAAELVDLLGQPTGQTVTLAGGEAKFRLRPWQIATLALSERKGE